MTQLNLILKDNILETWFLYISVSLPKMKHWKKLGLCSGKILATGNSEVKASACKAGDLGSIPGLERSAGEGNGKPLQYSCLENLMDWGAWWATVHRVAKSRTGLSNFTFTFTYIPEGWRKIFFIPENHCKKMKQHRKALTWQALSSLHLSYRRI